MLGKLAHGPTVSLKSITTVTFFLLARLRTHTSVQCLSCRSDKLNKYL